MKLVPLLAAVALIACKRTPTDPDTGSDTGDFEATACGEASERVGELACRHRIRTEADFDALAVTVPQTDILLSTKYLVPLPGAPLPTLFMNSRVFPLHHDFLVQAFPELYGALTPPGYLRLIFGPERSYYAGSLSLYREGTNEFVGFTVWEDPADPTTWLSQQQVHAAWLSLREGASFAELTFVPTGDQIARSRSWDADFPIAGPGPIAYEPYTTAVGYGRVRRYTVAELSEASRLAAFGYQDVLVLDQAPFDLERVISGVVTGTRQAPLSHLAVRSASRGTPNCFVADAYEALASWSGQLVRLECTPDELLVAPAELADAEAYWAALRPDPLGVPTPDLAWSALGRLADIPTSTPAERQEAVSRYGSKATNLATLYQRIDPSLQLRGFAIPAAYYEDFLESNTWVTDLGAGPVVVTFRDTIDAWLADPAFHADGALRRTRLIGLRTAMETGTVDPALIEALTPMITEVFGSPSVTVRFRSSSNAEDALGFTGAGLYSSASGCLADDLDGDFIGPSVCDPDRPDERTVASALARVWASLWSIPAWEERAWYGIPAGEVTMAVLANDRSEGELANIVAFTGDPVGSTDLWLVNAQAGEGSVVSPDPNEVPETVQLALADGQVTQIIRVTPSSEVPVGQVVLDDAALTALGAALWTVREVFPIDAAVPPGKQVLLDTEWKVAEDGRLVIKQVRPFLDAVE